MRLSRRSILALVLAVVLAGLVAAAPQKKAAGKGPVKIENTDPALRLKAFADHQALKAQSPFKDVKWRFIGPFDLSGRCTDVAVPAGSRTVFYAGAASGGIFKTVNAGTTWEPIFDDQPTMSIGDLAVAESDPEHRLGRHGRGQHLPRLHGRPGRLQVDRRRQDLEAHGPRSDFHHRPRRHPPRQSRHRLRRGHRPRVDRPTPTAASTRRPTAGRPGRRSSLSTSASAPTTWSWTRRLPTPSTPRPGTASAGAGAIPGPAARTASTRRPTAARPGRPSTPASRTRPRPAASASTSAGPSPRPSTPTSTTTRRGRSPSPARRTPTAGRSSGASSGPRSTAPTTPAPPGARSARRAWTASAAPTAGSSARSASTPTRPRPSTSWAWACRSRPTAARPSRTSTARGSTATTTACGSTPPTASHLINNNDGGVNISYDGGKTWRRLPRRHPVGPVLQRHPRQLDALLRLRLGPGPVPHRGQIPLRRPGAGGPAAGGGGSTP